MKLIDSSPYPHSIHILRSALEKEGIQSVLNNENLAQLSGEVPVTSCYLEIYVEDDLEARAILVRDSLRGDRPESVSIWTCVKCKEEIEEQFDICWNCETVKQEMI